MALAPRDLRRRLPRHYAPFAVATGVLLLTFMTLSVFDANKYPPPEQIMAGPMISGIFPDGGSTRPTGQTPGRSGGGETPKIDEMCRRPGMEQMCDAQPGAMPGMRQGLSRGAQPGAMADSHMLGMPSPQRLLMRRYTEATGYLALGFLGLTLLIGPATLLLGKRNPLSSYLRRDAGIVAAILSVAHVIFGFLVKHADGKVIHYFLSQGGGLYSTPFGLANYTGLIATLLIVGLAVISSNAAIRKLSASTWKRLQRLNYALFGLVVVHSVAYGALWRTASPYTRLLGLCVVAVLIGQLGGIVLYRRRRRLAAPQQG